MPRFMVIQFNIGTKNCSVLSQYGIAIISFDLYQSLIRVSGTLNTIRSVIFWILCSNVTQQRISFTSSSLWFVGFVRLPLRRLDYFLMEYSRNIISNVSSILLSFLSVRMSSRSLFLANRLLLLSYFVCFQGLDPKSFRFINYDALSDASVKHDACDATDATDDMCQSKA